MTFTSLLVTNPIVVNQNGSFSFVVIGIGKTTVPIVQGAVLHYYPLIDGILPLTGYRDKVDFCQMLNNSNGPCPISGNFSVNATITHPPNSTYLPGIYSFLNGAIIRAEALSES
ncbi:4383_t:CDS:2 [Dentiscutata heterogama]|uniref:4383_t:CDS:1 n=1 Tax=Dentiscutata heterogama TaxID=1316150 RepID=A0ACA9LWT2_9GLOM|nr:4383_t:CDS:2 [Dentiscutata heterogama]